MTNVSNNLQENFVISNKIVTLPLQSPLIKKGGQYVQIQARKENQSAG